MQETPLNPSFMHLHLGLDADGLDTPELHHIVVPSWERGVDAEQARKPRRHAARLVLHSCSRTRCPIGSFWYISFATTPVLHDVWPSQAFRFPMRVGSLSFYKLV